jgi:hypothetical protein
VITRRALLLPVTVALPRAPEDKIESDPLKSSTLTLHYTCIHIYIVYMVFHIKQKKWKTLFLQNLFLVKNYRSQQIYYYWQYWKWEKEYTATRRRPANLSSNDVDSISSLFNICPNQTAHFVDSGRLCGREKPLREECAIDDAMPIPWNLALRFIILDMSSPYPSEEYFQKDVLLREKFFQSSRINKHFGN